jgi:GGDEF domain-containing protein
MINKPINLPIGQTVNVEASFGLAEFDTDANCLTDLLEVADKNMYKHKKQKS